MNDEFEDVPFLNECDEECHWVKGTDSQGDLTEAHLTSQYTVYYCLTCGETTTEEPEEYEEPEPDYEDILNQHASRFPDY